MSAETSTKEATPLLTVAICTRDHKAILLETLQHLARQRAQAAWDVLVVANACTDGTEQTVEALAADFPVPLRVSVEPRPGLSSARNHALKAAVAPLVAFIDDDATCLEGWVDAYARAFEDETVVGAGGRIEPALPSSVPAFYAENLDAGEIRGPLSLYDFGDEPQDTGGPGKAHTPYGCNCSVRRELALEVGGFRLDLGWGAGVPGEETEFFERLREHGRIVYVPDCRVEHRILASRLTRDYFVQYHFSQGRAFVRLEADLHRGKHLRRLWRESRRVARTYLRTCFSWNAKPRTLARYAHSRGRWLEHA